MNKQLESVCSKFWALQGETFWVSPQTARRWGMSGFQQVPRLLQQPRLFPRQWLISPQSSSLRRANLLLQEGYGNQFCQL